MAIPELGTKQICPNCQAKFYDLGKRPAHCPKCSTDFDPDEAVRSRRVRARAIVPDTDDEAEDQVAAKAADAEDEEEEDEVTPELDEVVDEPPLAVLRHEVDPTPAKRFSLIETGPYLIMGGLGLFACAASAAAFRKAVSDPLPTNEFTIIAWVLALIGVICVGVSAWNLSVRATKKD